MDKKNVFVIGYSGYVGRNLIKSGFEPLDCDVTKAEEVREKIREKNPEFIIYCAAITDVEKCEENQQMAMAVNAYGVNNVLNSYTGKFIYLSTDHVFKGSRLKKYSEQDDPEPQNVYGLSKYAGEVMALMGLQSKVIRTSKLFSLSTLKSIIDKLQSGESVEFTTLIYRSFYHIQHFISSFEFYLENFDTMPNILHIASSNAMNYYQFWCEIAEELGLDKSLIRPRNYEIDAAPRPFEVRLSVNLARKYGIPIANIKDGIRLLKCELNGGL